MCIIVTCISGDIVVVNSCFGIRLYVAGNFLIVGLCGYKE